MTLIVQPLKKNTALIHRKHLTFNCFEIQDIEKLDTRLKRESTRSVVLTAKMSPKPMVPKTVKMK
jgi:hypothetical protein